MLPQLNMTSGIGLWLKWILLVWMNAIIGLVITWDNMRQEGMSCWLGIGLGVCAFIPLYALAELILRQRGVRGISKAMTIGVIIRALLQFVMMFDILAGMVGVSVAENVVGTVPSDFSHALGFYFVATVVTGGLLSVIAWLLTGLILLFIRFYAKKTPIDQSPSHPSTSQSISTVNQTTTLE